MLVGKERFAGIPREHFTDEARENLVNARATILDIGGFSITDLLQNSFRLRTSLNNSQSEYPSSPRQVAIWPDPAEFFIPGSFYKNAGESGRVLVEFNSWLRQPIPGVRAIRGSLADWAHVTAQFLERDGRLLFGPDYRLRVTLTADLHKSDKSAYYFGHFQPQIGPSAREMIDVRRFSTGLAKFVVPEPAQKTT